MFKIKEIKKRKWAIKVMLKFLLGEISTLDFWREYQINESLRNVLIDDKTRMKLTEFDAKKGKFVVHKNKTVDSLFDLNPENLLSCFDIENLEHIARLIGIVESYFIRRRQKITVYNQDLERYLFFYSMVPEWAGPIEWGELEKILNQVPENLSEEEKCKWGKEKIQSLFLYEQHPPEWVQNPEWPKESGEYMLFISQEPSDTESDCELYYFYNRSQAKTITVKQYY